MIQDDSERGFVADKSDVESWESVASFVTTFENDHGDLHAHNPGGNLLCGFSVRARVDGTWTEIES